MPELPEVECWGRRKAERALLGRRMEKAWAKPDETIVITGVAPRVLAHKLAGRSVVACHRVGKQMWFELDVRPHLLLHFGMTGSFAVYERASDRPKFAKLELTLDDGSRFAFADPRRFGRITVADDPTEHPSIASLGPDAWTKLPALRWWIGALAKRRAPIKAVLLDQGFIAGVGNWIADELCYQAGVDPHRLASDLARPEVTELRSTLKRVLDAACRWEADYERFPSRWLFHHRWGKPAGAALPDGSPISFSVVGGRTTAWVPSRQR